MPQTRRAKLFIASPSDVACERDLVDGVVARLNQCRPTGVQIDVYRWERSFYRANLTYQAQIPEPANCDLVIVVFGERLGSELPPEFRKRLPNGDAYPSGTAFELLSAMAAADLRGWPDVYVFRKRGVAEGADAQEKARLDAFFGRWFRHRTLPVHEFADADDFETKIENLLDQWVAERPSPTPVWRGEDGQSPFRGLEAFDARHAAVYFGRDRKVNRALEALLRAPAAENGRPFLLVVGASGSGKSSLVRAGLVRRLIAPGIAPGVEGWRVAVVRPGASPIATLAQALFFLPESSDEQHDPGGFGPALPELAQGSHKTAADLARAILTGPAAAAQPLVDALDRASGSSEGARRSRVDLLLVVDQLEEIFDNSVDEPQRTAFARALTAFCETRRIWVAATLRVDLYGRMIEAGTTWLPLKDTGGHYDLASPGEAEIKEILEKSAEAAGLAYEKDEASGETLDERLLADAKGSNDTLPLLEYSLDELFRRRRAVESESGARVELTFAAYKEIGGIDGVIEETAKRALADDKLGLSEAEIGRALSRLLRRLAVRVSDESAATAGKVRLTTRAVPLADLSGDAASRKLIEALLRARLFVSQDAEETRAELAPAAADREGAGDAPQGPGRVEMPRPEPMLRLAHERVLTSWSHARKIVEEFKTYFESRADLEQRYALWIGGGKRRELLLPAGKPLADAEALARDYRDELKPAQRAAGAKGEPTLLEFITVSGRRARLRQRLVGLAASVFFVVALIASAMFVIAYDAQGEAEANYKAAKGAGDELVGSIAGDLRKHKGIPPDALNVAFAAVERLLTRLDATVSGPKGATGDVLQESERWLSARLFGAADTTKQQDALQRSRATLFYEEAETYHQSANDNGAARAKAAASLAIQQKLRISGPSSQNLDAETAKTYIELGDLDRALLADKAKNQKNFAHPEKADFTSVRNEYESAEALLAPLAEGANLRLDWTLEETGLLTRLGDLDLIDKNRVVATSHYSAFQALAWRLYRAYPGEPDALHEIAWSYRKLGQVQVDLAVAAGDYADEVCVRRQLVDVNAKNSLWTQDLAFALVFLAKARLGSAPPDLPGASDAAYEALDIISTLAETDKNRKNFEQVAAGLRLIASIQTKANQTAVAGAFAAAAAAVDSGIKEAFAPLPSDEPARSQARADEDAMVERGVGAMIGDRRELATVMQPFRSTRLQQIRDAAKGCMQRLDLNFATGAVSSTGKP